MDFIEALHSFYSRYFDFQSRSSRSEYWWPFLFQMIALIGVTIVAVIAGVSASIGEANSDDLGGGFIIVIAILGMFYLANLIPNIAVAVRRFHDQDRSGWMYLLALIPWAGGIILIIFMCIDGTHGENRFGLDPLGDNLGDTYS